ncbi:helix-turn-helix domain-containing protein [Pedobacter sp. BG31]|uniref:helix-turn-helix domain-containing protein n=1 Tax=Pedobacter sp. BG31 TaxID=3349697 RepID=UPI0035F44A79
MNNSFKILSKEQYHSTMVEVYSLMNKGEDNLSDTELNRLQILSLEAERYENEELNLIPQSEPKSLVDVLEAFMYKNKMNRTKLAEKLHVGKPKLSQILNGKREVDVSLLKAIYSELKIDPAIILKYA